MTPIILPYKEFTPSIGEDSFIAPGAAVIGDVEIGKDSSIWFNCTLRGDVNGIRIGDRSNIQDGSVVHVATKAADEKEQGMTIVGNDVTVGHSVTLHACTLEDGCLIGMGATILDGAVVESGAQVAAGALVPPGKRVKSGQLWGGTPARFMRELKQAEKDYFAISARHYVDIAANYL